MSRIGKVPVKLSDKVQVDISENVIKIDWPEGQLEYNYPSEVVDLEKNEDVIKVKLKDKNKRNIWGLARSIISNMVHWVQEGYTKKLLVKGVGYNANIQGGELVLKLGFSHPVHFEIPEDIDISVEDDGDDNVIIVQGADKQKVGEVAGKIRAFREPEPYKGKGIRYEDEVVNIKPWKTESEWTGA